jgi:hypothetical protein
VCLWAPEELRPSSVTYSMWVDGVAPDCSLTSPTGPIGPADDLDIGTAGIQFSMTSSSDADDVEGEEAEFFASGQAFTGTAIDDAGESSAIATVNGAFSQTYRVELHDHAGNLCRADVAF